MAHLGGPAHRGRPTHRSVIDLLQERSDEFVEQLNRLIGGSVPAAPAFEAILADDTHRRIGPSPFSTDGPGFDFIPLQRDCDEHGKARLLLKVEFRVSLDDESLHLAVEESTYGLWVRPDPARRPRPVFRIEYERAARSVPAAHVHLHAESMEFGWIYGTAQRTPPRLSEIHFPVGGRRFRPTVEELLRFLDREGLFTNWLTGWESLVDASLAEWERNQARATVRQHPQAAVEQLHELGYQITPPASV